MSESYYSSSGTTIAKAALNVWPELGEALGVGRNTAYGLVNSGRIRSVRVGRRILVPTSAVDEFLENELSPAA